MNITTKLNTKNLGLHLKQIGMCICSIMLFCNTFGQQIIQNDTLSFFPNSDLVNNDTIESKYLLVPENWEDSNTNTIKIAIAVLKKKLTSKDKKALVFIPGGPGSSGIQNVNAWLHHPLRENNDIVLFDIRGTGNSIPRLCPDLGNRIFEILSKNQSEDKDEKEKVSAVLSCKQDLISRGIDINTYHSQSIAKDLNAIKSQLGYSDWIVYGSSYGTFMAQVYTSLYPKDVRNMILDSPIADIATYYTKNTSNYRKALQKVFEKCKGDKDCNRNYPDLENVYLNTIRELENNPITVQVDKSQLSSEKFTFNSEDFKVAIQQALYERKLIEVIPLLIYQFKERNSKVISNLIPAFSGLLAMDYGAYYCVSCNEALPNNEFQLYQKDALQYQGLSGGISFYKSDFKVCKAWNRDKTTFLQHDLSALSEVSFPILTLSGVYDPITPEHNGNDLAQKNKSVYPVTAYTYGHVPGFSGVGFEVANNFVKNPNQEPNYEAFREASQTNFVDQVVPNAGVSKLGKSLQELNMIFLLPLIIALSIMFGFILAYVVKLFQKKSSSLSNKMVRASTALTSVLGLVGLLVLIIALSKVSTVNYMILAFGLPDDFSFVSHILVLFAICLIVTMLFFAIRINKIENRSIVFSVVFSNILVITYLFYWGIF